RLVLLRVREAERVGRVAGRLGVGEVVGEPDPDDPHRRRPLRGGVLVAGQPGAVAELGELDDAGGAGRGAEDALDGAEAAAARGRVLVAGDTRARADRPLRAGPAQAHRLAAGVGRHGDRRTLPAVAGGVEG